MTDLPDLSNDELADFMEAAEAERRHLRLRDTKLVNDIGMASALLISRLGDGEAAIAVSTGRAAYKAEGPAGAARVNEDAIDEHEAELAEDLRPRLVKRYPNVGAIRQAAKDRRLPKGTTEDTFLVAAPPTSKLYWRSIEGLAA